LPEASDPQIPTKGSHRCHSAWLPLGTSVDRAARGRLREVRTPKAASHSRRWRRSTAAHWFRNPPGTGVLEPDLIQGSPAAMRVVRPQKTRSGLRGPGGSSAVAPLPPGTPNHPLSSVVRPLSYYHRARNDRNPAGGRSLPRKRARLRAFWWVLQKGGSSPPKSRHEMTVFDFCTRSADGLPGSSRVSPSKVRYGERAGSKGEEGADEQWLWDGSRVG